MILYLLNMKYLLGVGLVVVSGTSVLPPARVVAVFVLTPIAVNYTVF